MKRVAQRDIVARCCADEGVPETPLNVLVKEVDELGHCDLARGTKRAVLSGGGAFNGFLTQCRHNPQLELPGGSWILTALPDIWKKLEVG